METELVVFEIESKEYECSKEELCNSSEYFSIMFTADFAENKMSRIKLNNVTTTSWEHIQHFIKHGSIKIDWKKIGFLDEMLELLQTVNMFRFIDLEERCSNILSNAVDKQNCFKIWEVANRIQVNDLLLKAKGFALWHFDDVAMSDDFKNLPIDLIEGYLKNSALNCSSGEMGVWNAIDRWLNGLKDSSKTRRQHVPKLLLCLRPNALSLDDLNQMLSFEAIKDCLLVTEAIKEVIKNKKIMPSADDGSESKKLKRNKVEGSEELNSFVQTWLNVTPRRKAKVPCLVGNVNTGHDTASPYIIKFCESENKFVPLIWLEKIETGAGAMMGYKIVSDGFKVYLVGGLIMNRQNVWNDGVWAYDPLTKSWSLLARLAKPIRHMSACIFQNELYIIGGFGRHRVIQNQVSKLCLNNRVWFDCANAPQHLYSTPCVVFKNYIYLVDCNVYEYCPKTDVWRTVLTKPFARGFSCAVSDNNYIYLAGSCSNVIYKFDPKNLTNDLEVLGHFKHECAQICLVEDFIYSLSQDEHADDIFCEKMNVKTGEVVLLYEGTTDSIIADITPRHRHGCFSVFTY